MYWSWICKWTFYGSIIFDCISRTILNVEAKKKDWASANLKQFCYIFIWFLCDCFQVICKNIYWNRRKFLNWKLNHKYTFDISKTPRLFRHVKSNHHPICINVKNMNGNSPYLLFTSYALVYSSSQMNTN